MKNTVSRHEFAEALADDFSRGAASALFDWYTELEDSTGQEIELDPIGIRCDWSEYASAIEAFEDYVKVDTDTDEELDEDECLRFFERETTVLQFDGGIVIEAY